MMTRLPSLRSTPKFANLVVLTLLAFPAATLRLRAEEPAAVPAKETEAHVTAPTEAKPALAVLTESKAAETNLAEVKFEEPKPTPAKPGDPAPPETKAAPTPATAVAPAVAHAGTPAPATTPQTEAAPPSEPRAPRALAPPTVSAKEGQGLVNLGHSLTERGDYDAAEIAYRQVLNGHAPVEPTKSALLGLAHMHRKQGYLTKAAAIYERYLKDYPNDDRVPDALLDLGRTLRDMGAPRLAIARFYNVINSTLKLSTTSGFEHYQLLAKTAQFEVAETHFQAGEYAEATKFFSRLRMLDLAPSDRARAHFKSAYSLQLAGDPEGAVTALRSFLEQWPDDDNVPEARYLLATTLRSLKRTQEALATTIDLLMVEKTRTANDPKRWSYWQRRTGNQLANEFFQSGDTTNALVIYQGLATLSDDPAWRIPVVYQVALCYERLSDLDRACKTYRSIVDAAGAKPVPEVADTARMASSRLAHIDWHEATDRQVATLFDSSTGQLNTPAPKPSSSHDSNRSPAPASPAL